MGHGLYHALYVIHMAHDPWGNFPLKPVQWVSFTTWESLHYHGLLILGHGGFWRGWYHPPRKHQGRLFLLFDMSVAVMPVSPEPAASFSKFEGFFWTKTTKKHKDMKIGALTSHPIPPQPLQFSTLFYPISLYLTPPHPIPLHPTPPQSPSLHLTPSCSISLFFTPPHPYNLLGYKMDT